MNSLCEHGRGRLGEVKFPLMVNDKKNEEKLCTAFTVSMDVKHGTATGVSDHDRATTVLALATRDSSAALRNFKLFNGLHPGDLCSVKLISSESFKWLNARAHLIIKNEFKINSAFLSCEGDVHSQSRRESSLFSSLSTGTETQPDAVDFGTLAADVVPTMSDFPSDDDEFDLDSLPEGFSSVPEAIEDIRQGKMVLVIDDEGRENEGDLVMVASKATLEAMAFSVKHGT